jgi:peptide/nickel transport system substrate-binding protein
MRRTARYLAAAGVAVLAVLAGCSTQKSAIPSSGSAGATGSSSAAAALVMTDGGGTTFIQNFNPYAVASVAGNVVGDPLVYETLLAVDKSQAGKFLPWLATSYAYSNGGKTLTFKLRQGVKWSDGTPFTSADVKFTLDMIKSGQTPYSGAWSSVEAPNPYTVVVNYPAPDYADLTNFGWSYVIVPQHIWANQNVRTWTDPNPVGTGPFTLASFSPQSVTFKIRSDYWGGPGKGVKEVRIVPSTDDAAVESQLISNQLDWSSIGWPDANQEYVANDPAHHIFRFYPTGSEEGPVFNTTQAPYNDVHVRLALSDALNPVQIDNAVGIGFTAPNAAGLDPSLYQGDTPSQFSRSFTQNASQAKAELAAGGWTVSNGDLVKGGKSYALTYDVYQPYAEWVTEAQFAAAQWKSVLGLNVTVKQLGSAPFTTADENGSFGIDSETPTAAGDIYQAYSSFLTQNYVPIGKAALFNTGRWTDPRFQQLMAELAALPPADTAQAVPIAEQIQEEVASQAPFAPLADSGWKAEMDTVHWTGWPQVGSTYVPNPTIYDDVPQVLLNLSPAS